ncbi:hypothetical protein C8R44DRAFT_945226 [Mycena epipterygia]|nr:hypothetical protein C8R44DRAFT_945226 [Mycena epipterygia]
MAPPSPYIRFWNRRTIWINFKPSNGFMPLKPRENSAPAIISCSDIFPLAKFKFWATGSGPTGLSANQYRLRFGGNNGHCHWKLIPNLRCYFLTFFRLGAHSRIRPIDCVTSRIRPIECVTLLGDVGSRMDLLDLTRVCMDILSYLAEHRAALLPRSPYTSPLPRPNTCPLSWPLPRIPLSGWARIADSTGIVCRLGEAAHLERTYGQRFRATPARTTISHDDTADDEAEDFPVIVGAERSSANGNFKLRYTHPMPRDLKAQLACNTYRAFWNGCSAIPTSMRWILGCNLFFSAWKIGKNPG